jgi:hypothetical protein
MAIRVDFSDLRQSVKAMGAELVDFELRFDPGKLEQIDIDLMGGIEVDINDVDLENGILSYQGRQVLLYIQDHGGNVQKALDDGSTGRRYHVADCSTLQEMRAKNRFERYVATNDLSGSFFISGQDWGTHQMVEGTTELKVCKNCLTKLNYQGYSTGRKKGQIFQGFTIGEFFSTFSSFFKYMPKRRAGSAVSDDYTADWADISGRYKAVRKFCCEQCHVDLPEHKNLLHTHHINGVKKDNSNSNLRALCSDCHRKQPMHEQLFVSHEDTRLINHLRRAQAKMPNGDWDEVIELADRGLEGLLKQCQHSYLELPEVGYELQANDEAIIAELELAWPESKVGVAIGEEDKAVAEKAGWEIWSMIDAIDRFDQFQQRL